MIVCEENMQRHALLVQIAGTSDWLHFFLFL